MRIKRFIFDGGATLFLVGAMIAGIGMWGKSWLDKRKGKQEALKEVKINNQEKTIQQQTDASVVKDAIQENFKPLDSAVKRKGMTPKERTKAALDAIGVGARR